MSPEAEPRPVPEAESRPVTEEELARARAPELLVRKTLVYRAARRFFWTWFKLSRARFEGAENVPSTGPCLIIANHQSYFDIPLVAASLSRHVCFVARDSLAKSRGIAFLIKWCGAVMVRRGQTDRSSIREILDHLERGDAVCIFPEGTRSKDGRVGEFQRGLALIARQANAPIVAAGIRGTIDILPKDGSRPRLAPCSIRYGPPIADPQGSDALERARAAVIAIAGDGLHRGGPAAPPPGA